MLKKKLWKMNRLPDDERNFNRGARKFFTQRTQKLLLLEISTKVSFEVCLACFQFHELTSISRFV